MTHYTSEITSTVNITQSYAGHLEQTFKFPLRRPEALAAQADSNLELATGFVGRLGAPDRIASDRQGPVWLGVPSSAALEFLGSFQTDEQATSISLPLICRYIEQAVACGELVRWGVGVRGRANPDARLGRASWVGAGLQAVNQISRTRLAGTDSLGVITDPDDELLGLSAEDRERARGIVESPPAGGSAVSVGVAAREVRSPEEGLLLLYPISRNSRPESEDARARRPLFEEPDVAYARDLVGLAISFPRSDRRHAVSAYLQGTVSWRPVDA